MTERTRAVTDGDSATPIDPAHNDDDRPGAAWAYLAVLFAIFIGLGFAVYACEADTPASSRGDAVDTAGSLVPVDEGTEPVDLTMVIAGESVTLQGTVPDEGARQQLLALAQTRYLTVIDELDVDPATTFRGGTIRLAGTTSPDDGVPTLLLNDLVRTFGIAAGDSSLTFDGVAAEPATVNVNFAAEHVAISGVVPDQGIADGIGQAATDTWGEAVDLSGLSVGSVSWATAQVEATGTADAGDPRPTQFFDRINELLPGGIQIATAGLGIDGSPEALGRSQARLRDALSANPILFASGSADIDPASDEILVLAAQAISAAPGIDIEIVGHTDDTGTQAINQPLSAERAEAVLNRLVELGIESERLSSRGAGSSEPIADNSTDEGKAANRRIEFGFAGAVDPAPADADEGESTEGDSAEGEAEGD